MNWRCEKLRGDAETVETRENVLNANLEIKVIVKLKSSLEHRRYLMFSG